MLPPFVLYRTEATKCGVLIRSIRKSFESYLLSRSTWWPHIIYFFDSNEGETELTKIP